MESWKFGGSTCGISGGIDYIFALLLGYRATSSEIEDVKKLRQPKWTSSDYRGYTIFKDTPHDPRRIHLNHNRLDTNGFLPGKIRMCRWRFKACRWWFAHLNVLSVEDNWDLQRDMNLLISVRILQLVSRCAMACITMCNSAAKKKRKKSPPFLKVNKKWC